MMPLLEQNQTHLLIEMIHHWGLKGLRKEEIVKRVLELYDSETLAKAIIYLYSEKTADIKFLLIFYNPLVP